LNISYEKNLIKRNKKTRQQSQLLKKERILNIKNAFKVDEKLRDKIDKKNIIIVDDVVST
jgi:predicted amidophosphoribosyltransferase